MQTSTILTIAIAALLQGATAVPAPEITSSPTSLPGHYVCTSITTITTTQPPIFQCLPVCSTPSSVCSPGEPTAKPFPTITTTPSPGCTASVVVVEGGCDHCPTCHLPNPTA
ncbi:uncharacterized protein GGS22DRAFT_189663 [Annulohypoxylon maeteangense]|uniref:uncharacterized protein n=1 Tax=Annulohypoxylon maeteangense TaxID=1927788 RepID=UPI00200796BE|nr:uncharacterized protein GGS22DRAFT_189663 [Annulohypoxylon maeteangense]KAI0883696.1 hypothetical protein GGS22DRAFT_189663 [Annulohypoxylon maeteangense]